MENLEVRLKEAKGKFERARKSYVRLQERYDAKLAYPEALKLKGQIFRFDNCYSCPNGPEDHWDIFARIIEVHKSGTVVVQKLQIDKYGHSSIEPRSIDTWGRYMGDGLIAAAKGEWNEELRRHKKLLAQFEIK